MLASLSFSRKFKQLLFVFIILGIGFRFFNLAHPVYWYDETQTSLRIAGYTKSDLVQQIYKAEIVQVGDFLKTYQYPNSDKNLNDVIQALIQHPEHSPFYYLSARFWLQIFPHSVSSLRSLSALISLLVFPTIYLLCWELFQSKAVGLMAMSLLAVSPFHVIYAQEAREYSLWTVTILLSSAALLRAIRLDTTAKLNRFQFLNWEVYGLTTVFGWYTHPFSILVTVGQGIYVWITSVKKTLNQVLLYGYSVGLSLLLFLPWLWIILVNLSDFLGNTKSTTVPREGLPLFWGLNLGRLFFDVNQGTSLLNPTLYFFLFITGYAIYILIRTTPAKTWLLIITLMGVLGMGLMVPDLILGGRRSSITRYGIPCYLGIQIAVAYLLTFKLQKYHLWKIITLSILSLGILSCAVRSHYPVWWNKSYAKSRYLPQVAEVINQAENPVVISDEEPGRILSLCHRLHSTVSLQLVPPDFIPDFSQYQTNHIFLFRPSQTLQNAFKNNSSLQLKKAYQKGWIWQVIFKSESPVIQ